MATKLVTKKEYLQQTKEHIQLKNIHLRTKRLLPKAIKIWF